MTFRKELIIGITIIELIFLSILIYTSIHYVHEVTHNQLQEHANVSAALVATAVENSIMANDIGTMNAIATKVHEITPCLLKITTDDHHDIEKDSCNGDNNIIYGYNIIMRNNYVFGTVIVGISDIKLHHLIVNMWKELTIIAVIGLFFSILFSIILTNWLENILISIQKNLINLKTNEYIKPIMYSANDELGKLINQLNNLTTSFNDTNRSN